MTDQVHPYGFPPEWHWRQDHGSHVRSGIRAFARPDFSRLPEAALKDRPTFDRLVLSLRDFSHARSAITFIEEEVGDDDEEKYTLAELRKFACYETMLIVAYARPFSESRGLPRLTFQQLAVKLSPFNRLLHEEMITLRNKVFAHSEDEHIPRSSGWAMRGNRDGGGDPFTVYVPPRFQEGILLSYAKAQQVSVLMSSIVDAVVHRLQAMHVHFLDELPVHDFMTPDE